MNNKETAQQIKALGNKLLNESQDLKELCNDLDTESWRKLKRPSYELIKSILNYTSEIHAILIESELLEIE